MIINPIPKKKLNTLPFVLYFFGFQGALILSGELSRWTPYASFIGTGLLIAIGIGFYHFLLDTIVSFEIKWTGKELHLERIMGKGNHVYLVIPVDKLLSFQHYSKQQRVGRNQWFCHRSTKTDVYVLETTEGRRYVLSPSPELLNALMGVLNAKSTL